jgi:transposase-like protein
MSRLRAFANDRPVEIVCGVFLIGLGLALAAADGWPRIAGNVAAAVGGVLLSWVTAIYLSREQIEEVRRAGVKARDDALATQEAQFATQIAAVSRQLGTASAQIKEAVNLTLGGHWKPETCFALVQQATAGLYGLVNELQSMLGDRFDPDAIIETASTLGSLGTRLHELTAQSFAAPETRDELQGVVETLEALSQRLVGPQASTAAGSSHTLEAVECPECGREVQFRLGNLSGSTQMPTCSVCGARFNAHRGRDGSIFTNTKVILPSPGSISRTPKRERIACPHCETDGTYELATHGGATAQPVCDSCGMQFNLHRRADGTIFTRRPKPPVHDFEVHCPTCEKGIRIQLTDPDVTTVTRLCFGCWNRLVIDVPGQAIREHHEQVALDAITDPTRRNALICPTCRVASPVFTRRGELAIATCSTCSALLRTPPGPENSNGQPADA